MLLSGGIDATAMPAPSGPVWQAAAAADVTLSDSPIQRTTPFRRGIINPPRPRRMGG